MDQYGDEIKDFLRNTLKPRFPDFWKQGRSTWKYVEGFLGLRSFPRYVYYKELDTIFIAISKNANTTINRMFLDKLGYEYDPDNYKSIHGQKNSLSITQKEFLDMDTDDVFVFTFARNPFTRLVSAYKNKVVGESYQPIMQNYYGRIYPNMTFAEFVNETSEIPDWWADEHFRSQVADMYPKSTDKIDYMGKVENFTEDIKVVREKLDLPNPKSMNQSTKKKKPAHKYYTKELAKKVYERYQDDFNKLGYGNSFQEAYNTSQN